MPTTKQAASSGFLPIIVVLGCAAGLAYFLTINKRVPEPAPQEVFVPLVEVVDLAPQAVRFMVSGQGNVQPAFETQIVTEVSGALVSVSDEFVAGSTLLEGHVLVKIDPAMYIVERDEARAVLNQRQLEYDGIARLGAGSYRSKLDLAAARSALASARAAYARAQTNLAKTQVRMPYDGVVRLREVAPGQFVSRGTSIGSVFSSDRVEVRLALGQEDLKFVDLPKTGQLSATDARPVRLTGRYRGMDAAWGGRIVRTEGVVDTGNRTTFVVVEVLDPYQQQPFGQQAPLPIGTFVSAEIPGRYMRDVMVFPRQAMRGNGRLVFVDEEHRLRLQDVPVIRADAQRVYVRADALEQRRLVLTTLETPVNGRKVRVAVVDNPFAKQLADHDSRPSPPNFLQLDGSLSEASGAGRPTP
ncbi:MAG: efflux RND transporter periplasmic adaptor subunit [Gammaproteobacteria bacterium]